MAMKLIYILFAVLATTAIASATNFDNEDAEAHTSLRGASRFLTQKGLLANASCDKFPKVCHLKNSPGKNCCKYNCVDVKTDRYNCGKCGHKCKYTEICCRGKCINASFDKRHCGGCNQKCKKGEFCVYGMCNYA